MPVFIVASPNSPLEEVAMPAGAKKPPPSASGRPASRRSPRLQPRRRPTPAGGGAIVALGIRIKAEDGPPPPTMSPSG